MLYLNDVDKKVIKIINKALLQVIIDGYELLLECLEVNCTKISIKGFILSEWFGWQERRQIGSSTAGFTMFYVLLRSPRLSSSFLSFSVLKMSFP